MLRTSMPRPYCKSVLIDRHAFGENAHPPIASAGRNDVTPVIGFCVTPLVQKVNGAVDATRRAIEDMAQVFIARRMGSRN